MATSPSICATARCAQAVSSMALNFATGWEHMDPCTQLPQIVCGGAKNVQQPGYNVVGQIREQNIRIVRSILEGPYDSNLRLTMQQSRDFNETIDLPETTNHMKLQTFYKSCMNTGTVTEDGLLPLQQLFQHLDTVLWPVDEDTQFGELYNSNDPTQSKGFSDAQNWLHSLGVGVFFRNAIFPSVVTKDVANLVFLPSKLGIKGSSQEDIEAYAKEIATIFTGDDLYPGNLTATQALQFGTHIAKMEGELYSIHPGGIAGDVTEALTEIPYEELLRAAPNLAIDKLIAANAPEGFVPNQILIQSQSYMANVSSIVARQTVPALQLYMFTRAVREMGEHTLHNKTANLQTHNTREAYCMARVEVNMRELMDSFFIRASHWDTSQSAGTEMVQAIRSQFKKRIDAIDWMSSGTKAAAHTKVNKLHVQVGYPTKPVDVTSAEAVAAHYQAAAITDSHFDNVVALASLQAGHEWSKLGKPLEHGDFEKPTWAVNAAYRVERNSIEVNAGIMHLPVFQGDMPSSINYGGLGAACGHELIHGFDSTGLLFDGDGLKQTWWDSESFAQATNRSRCFVDQFNNYDHLTTNGMIKVDGKVTLNENLADAGGLNLAFEAWRAASNGTELLLPRLDAVFNTPEKQFFLAHASFFCDNPTLAQNDVMAEDPHAPNMARITSAMVNSKYFQEAFQCPDTPRTRCEVW